MKIAIICDWLVVVGGAEKVLSELFHCFPQADLFATIDHFNDATRATLGIPKARTTFIQKIPFIKKIYRYTLPIMPIAIEQLDVSDYDLVVSSSHSIAKGIKTHPRQKHVCYIHSPMRYAWNLQEQYLSHLSAPKKLLRPLMRYFLAKLRQWDKNNTRDVAHFIANSKYIANRVREAYDREADVIYPPVDTEYFTSVETKNDFYLTASRLVSYKRVDLIVDCFARLPNKQSIVIGDGPELNQLKEKATPNVTFLGFQPTDILKEYLQEAKVFLFAAEEDFGITPLEAQACGTPVIAYGKGGALETVRDTTQTEPTGLFFSEQTSDALYQAIMLFDKNNALFNSEHCRQNALKFSKEAFRRLITEKIMGVMS